MRKIISCGIYLFRNDNKFLIAHPTNFKETIWGVPKGRIDEGETDMFEVAKRELFEETNINLNDYDIKKFKEFELTHFKGNKYFKGFMVYVDSDFSNTEIKCDSMVIRNGEPVFPEMDDFKWVTIDEGKEILGQYQSVNLDDCYKLLDLIYLKRFESYKDDESVTYLLFK